MRKILTIIGGLMFTLASWGQGELSVSVGGGLNTIFTDPKLDRALSGIGQGDADARLSPGFLVSSRFLYFFGNGHLGLGSGADFVHYSSSLKLDGELVTPSYDDINGQAFDLIQSYAGWQEKQRLFTLEFPLGFYYKAIFSDKTNLVLGLGGKLVVPAFSRYQITDGVYEVSGYYPQTDVTIRDLPHHGFSGSAPVANGGLNTRVAFSVYGEVGMNFAMSDHLLFHVGLYANYGITNIIADKKHEPSLWDDFMVDNESAFSLKVTEKAKLFSAGLKLGITIPTNAEGNTEGTSREEKIAKSIE